MSAEHTLDMTRVEAKRVQVAEEHANEEFVYQEDEDEEEETFTPPDPFHLKDVGNKQFAAGNVAAAIDIWKLALKEALKKSCHDPSKDLFEIQMALRMNLALGFMKEDDLVMAKEHMMVVFENKHNNPKVFYRLGEIYLGLQDYDKARMVVKGGLKEFENDAALRALSIKVEQEARECDRQVEQRLKKIVTLDLGDDRSNRVPPPGVKHFRREDWKALLCGEAGADRTWPQLTQELIEWRHDTNNLGPGEVQSDIDDWASSSLWRVCWTAERLKHDHTVLHATLPLTLLSVLETVLLTGETQQETPVLETRFRDETLARPCLASCLPSTSLPECSPNFAPDPATLKRLKLHVVDWLSRSAATLYRPFTVHCLGARGDMEMESKWGLILERCPALETLQVVMVGFRDSDDPYNRKLSQTEEYLSPPLTKKNSWRLSQKMVARLYKGDYMAFLRSKLVASTTDSETLKGEKLETPAGGPSIEIPPMLADLTHPFHPDLIMIPEPDVSRYLKDWLPALALLALAKLPILFLGQSVLSQHVSHEMLSLPSLLNLLRFRWMTPISWNKFAIPLDPGTDAPPMPIEVNSKTEMYEGPSGKFAFTVVVQGFLEEDSATRKTESLLIRLANGEDVLSLFAPSPAGGEPTNVTIA